jgi:hypothetical protein
MLINCKVFDYVAVGVSAFFIIRLLALFFYLKLSREKTKLPVAFFISMITFVVIISVLYGCSTLLYVVNKGKTSSYLVLGSPEMNLKNHVWKISVPRGKSMVLNNSDRPVIVTQVIYGDALSKNWSDIIIHANQSGIIPIESIDFLPNDEVPSYRSFSSSESKILYHLDFTNEIDSL